MSDIWLLHDRMHLCTAMCNSQLKLMIFTSVENLWGSSRRPFYLAVESRISKRKNYRQNQGRFDIEVDPDCMGQFLHRCYYSPSICESESNGHPPAMSMTSLTLSPCSHSTRIPPSAKAVQCLPSLLRCQKTLPALVHLQSSHQTHPLCVTSSQIPCHAHVALSPYTRPNSHPNPLHNLLNNQPTNQPHHFTTFRPKSCNRERKTQNQQLLPTMTNTNSPHTNKNKCTCKKNNPKLMSIQKLQHMQN